MLDVGWSEMAIVAVIALFVIGPKELPRVLRTIGRYAGKIKAVAREFQDSIDDAVREAELDDVKQQIESVGKMDLKKSISDTIDPGGEMGKAMNIPANALTGANTINADGEKTDGKAGGDKEPDAPTDPTPALTEAPAPATPSAAEADADTSKAGA